MLVVDQQVDLSGIVCVCVCVCVCDLFILWHTSPQWTRATSVSRLHDHSDTPHLVELLWTNNQSDAETSTWQHTTLTGDRCPCPHPHPGGTRDPSNRANADLHPKPARQPDSAK